jgi:hypothetical protein
MRTTTSFALQLVHAGAILLAICAINSTQAALVYWQNFEGANGVEDSGSGVGGNLAAAGSATFATTSGVFGNVLDVTANTGSSLAGTSLGSSTATGGSGLDLGTLNDFTVSMWVNTAQFATGTDSNASRVLIVGDSGTTDALQAGTFAISQAKSGFAAGPTGFNLFFDATQIGNALGGLNTAGEWTFIAFSFSTSDTDTFYRGTESTSVGSGIEVPNTIASGLAIGTGGAIFLGNRPAGARSFDGFIDDVRIYNTALSAAEVESVRLAAIPEPTAIGYLCAFLATLGVLHQRRKLNNR